METKHKNILIGGLLAIVLVMAVGYAAFATQLNINGTAEISSKWSVHFDKAAYSEATDITAEKTFAGGSLPTGTLTYADGDAPLSATVQANLNQPGDKVTFTLRIINDGNLKAKAGTPTLSGSGFEINGLTALSDSKHIKFTVTAPATNVLDPAGTKITTMTVVAEFMDYTPATGEGGNATPESTTSTGNMEAESSAELTISLEYTQA